MALVVSQANEVIRLVEHLVYGMECRQRSLHTLLFSLYVRYQPQKTLPYLNAHGEDLRAVPYDAQSALRLCLAADTPQLQVANFLTHLELVFFNHFREFLSDFPLNLPLNFFSTNRSFAP